MRESITPQGNEKSKGPYYVAIFVVIILVGLALSFHFVPYKKTFFAKDHLTFSHTFITSDDVDDLIERYNNSTFFEKAATLQDPFYKKLVENGILNPRQWEEGDENYSTNDGGKTGVVVRINKDGSFYEGELNLLTVGTNKSINMIAETFKFSVPAEETEIIKVLEEASLSGERIKMLYRLRNTTVAGNKKNIVVKVERYN